MRLGVRQSVSDGRVIPGDVEVDSGVVTRLGVLPAGRGGTAVPGYIDLQVNGFAGVDFSMAAAEDYAVAATAMAATGVTAFQPTFISLPLAAYPAALHGAGQAQERGSAPRILGVHLEGPFLSPGRMGAHDPANAVSPEVAAMEHLLEAGPVTYVTIAPELPGAIPLIELCVQRNVTVALGHSDADAATATAAFAAGAAAVTHLFNAQRPWSHRDPGIAGAALVHDAVVVTLILDGHHLAPETVELVRRCAPGRIALITDAIAATGRPDGSYPLGDRRVVVHEGKATLEEGTLAGSVLTMDRAFRAFVAHGASLAEAVAATSVVPAALVGRPKLGSLKPGTAADVTVIDDRLDVVATLVAGNQIWSG